MSVKGSLSRVLGLGVVLVASVQAGFATGTLIGRVTDLFGRSIHDARVEVHPDYGTVRVTNSDPSGEFVLNEVDQGSGKLKVLCSGFEAGLVDYYLPDKGRSVVEVGLEVGEVGGFESYPVRGTVKSEKGLPVQDATVSLTNIFNRRLSITARTDRSGNYELSIHQAGQYILMATKPGLSADSKLLILDVASKKQEFIGLILKTLTVR